MSSRLPSLARRLLGLVVLSVTGAVAVASVLSAWNEAERYLASRRDVLLASAQIFASATSRAVAEGDGDAVMQAIRAVAHVRGLTRAGVLDTDGRVLAEVGTAARLTGDLDLTDASVAPLSLLGAETVTITVPVIDGGRRVGTLTLVSDLDGLTEQLAGVLWNAGLSALLALVVGLGLASRLQRSVIAPLAALTRAMHDVERTRRYAPVAIEAHDSETSRLTASFNGMITEVERQTAEILARENEIIDRLARAGEMRDDQTGQHVARVATVSRLIAEALRMDATYVEELTRASPLHDVGKISIPDGILHKPGRLDAEERAEMERGHEILSGSRSSLVQLAAEIALTHHERWDGQGYPRRLAGEAIPLAGRITAVADVCDALLSSRPYKEPWPLAKVRAHLTDNAGSHFDPACVDALLSQWREIAEVYRRDGTPDDQDGALAAA
jgi:putative two-component system response regulator